MLAAFVLATSAAHAQERVEVRLDTPAGQFNRQLFGQFAEHLGTGIYGGIWVGPGSKIPNIRGYRKDVVDALKAIHVPMIRWPGGCYADEYHWREGIGPRATRPVKINTNWGGVTEDNAFGTHEFMDFAELVGAEAYVAGNVGSSPPREMAEWFEYMTTPSASSLGRERAANGRKAPWKVPYFGIGNELWGCGGQMTADYAADETRRYSTFLKGPGIKKFASGPSGDDYAWTETMMRKAAFAFDGIGLHYYTVPGDWTKKGSATDFGEEEYARTLRKTLAIDEMIERHARIMDKYDPAKRVWLTVDEWGTWYDSTPGSRPGFLQQQNTMRDAIVAALNFTIFARHVDRLKAANIAQMVNVLQAIILTDGARMVRTPTYWVFDLYQPYQDATVLPVEVTSRTYRAGAESIPAISASAVRGRDGKIHIGLVNVDPRGPSDVKIHIAGIAGRSAAGRVVTAPAITAFNSFDRPDTVRPVTFSAASVVGDTVTVTLPARSVVMLDIG